MSPDTVAFASPVFDPLASAAVLTQARLGQLPRPLDLPAALRPQDAAQAYAVQDAVVQARGRVVGWKVGAANPQALPYKQKMTLLDVMIVVGGLTEQDKRNVAVFLTKKSMPASGDLPEVKAE